MLGNADDCFPFREIRQGLRVDLQHWLPRGQTHWGTPVDLVRLGIFYSKDRVT